MIDKTRLRSQYKKELEQFCKNETDKKSSESEIVKTLLSLLKPEQTVASYHSLPGEPDLSELHDKFDADFVFPKINGGDLDFYRTTQFSVGRFGILEPVSNKAELVSIEEIDVFIVPGISFSVFGERLGRGQAYYDRTLKNYNGKKIGVGFSVQMSEDHLPMEDHDIQMDIVVTDRGVNQCKW